MLDLQEKNKFYIVFIFPFFCIAPFPRIIMDEINSEEAFSGAQKSCLAQFWNLQPDSSVWINKAGVQSNS